MDIFGDKALVETARVEWEYGYWYYCYVFEDSLLLRYWGTGKTWLRVMSNKTLKTKREQEEQVSQGESLSGYGRVMPITHRDHLFYLESLQGDIPMLRLTTVRGWKPWSLHIPLAGDMHFELHDCVRGKRTAKGREWTLLLSKGKSYINDYVRQPFLLPLFLR